jgi:hypothetical protein
MRRWVREGQPHVDGRTALYVLDAPGLHRVPCISVPPYGGTRSTDATLRGIAGGCALRTLYSTKIEGGRRDRHNSQACVAHIYFLYSLSSERVWLLLHDKMTYDNIYNFPLPVN